MKLQMGARKFENHFNNFITRGALRIYKGFQQSAVTSDPHKKQLTSHRTSYLSSGSLNALILLTRIKSNLSSLKLGILLGQTIPDYRNGEQRVGDDKNENWVILL